jgi:hypothetical protein
MSVRLAGAMQIPGRVLFAVITGRISPAALMVAVFLLQALACCGCRAQAALPRS